MGAEGRSVVPLSRASYLCLVSASRGRVATNEPSIDHDIDGDDEDGQAHLDAVRQPRRIDDGQEVVLDEALAVP